MTTRGFFRYKVGARNDLVLALVFRMRLTRAVMFAVMENALKVWGLRLVRWGSKEMQQVHDRPEYVFRSLPKVPLALNLKTPRDRLVEAFLLNHQLHWFSIRQFGNSDRFYNLDSCIPEPVWISAMYLGLTLREMERQGESV